MPEALNEPVALAIETKLAAVATPTFNATANVAFRAEVYRREHFSDEWSYFFVVRAGVETSVPNGVSSSTHTSEFFVLGCRRYDHSEVLPWRQTLATPNYAKVQNQIVFDVELALCSPTPNLGLNFVILFQITHRDRSFVVPGWSVVEFRATAEYVAGFGACA